MKPINEFVKIHPIVKEDIFSLINKMHFICITLIDNSVYSSKFLIKLFF